MPFSEIPLIDINAEGKSVFSNDEIPELLQYSIFHAKTWDIGLGFFALSGFKALAWPLARFLLRGGKIRIYCNECISERDYNRLTQGEQQEYEPSFITDIKTLYDNLTSPDDRVFSKCISYFIANEQLAVKVLLRRDTERGVSHHKNFLFSDEEGNDLVVSGSANISETAFRFNNEIVNVFSSTWCGTDSPCITNQTIQSHKNHFADNYNGQNGDWLSFNIEAPEVKKRLRQIGFQDSDPEDTMTELQQAMAQSRIQTQLPLALRRQIESEIQAVDPNYNPLPSFPYDKPHPYQTKAYVAWRDSGFKGIFAMATGTGKTLTAINCLLEEYDRVQHRYIVVVPDDILKAQWEEELRSSNFGYIYMWGRNNDINAQRISNLLNGDSSKINIIITYTSFVTDRFQNVICEHLNSFTIVFDECHVLGTENRINRLPDLSHTRLIGLSATPRRQWDEINANAFINELFGCAANEYTFEYPLKQAIDDKRLVPYDYVLYYAHMNDSEWEEYCDLTGRIITGDSDGNPIPNKEVAIQRARIIHRVESKLDATEQIIKHLKESNNYRHTIVYAPEGSRQQENREDKPWIDIYMERIQEKFPEVYVGRIDNRSENRDRAGILETFREGQNLHILLSMKMLDQGVDIPNVRNAVLIASGAGSREHIQRRGRLLRTSPNKSHAVLYDIMVLPPIHIYATENNTAKGQILNEFRRVHEFTIDSRKPSETQLSMKNNEYLCNHGLTYDVLEQELNNRKKQL